MWNQFVVLAFVVQTYYWATNGFISSINRNSRCMINENAISKLQYKDTQVYSSYSTTNASLAATNKRTKKYYNNSHNSLTSMTMEELMAPLLDKQLLQSVVNELNRPPPREYLSRPLVIVGPSGVGKNRLIRTLSKDYGRFFRKVVTHTTRRPRPGEVNGTNYHFVSKELFLHLQSKSGYFVETATVHNNLYGLSYSAWQVVHQSGLISIFEVDIQGAESIYAQREKLQIKPNFIFIAPPNIDGLRVRLTERGTETQEEIELRLKNAEIEIDRAKSCDFFGKYLVNDDIYRASDAFYRFARDCYPKLPSASKLGHIRRRIKELKYRLQNQILQEQANKDSFVGEGE